ncbi:MAG: hypothetical protein WCJ36_01970 [Candidatus Saccharibacteria bacterium]
MVSKPVSTPESVSVSAIGEPWCSPIDEQIELATYLNKEQKWGFMGSDFPIPATDFVRLTPTEEMVLVVYLPKTANCLNPTRRTFEEYAHCISKIHKNSRGVSLSLDPRYLNLLMPEAKREPGIRFVAFDPVANWDLTEGCRVIDLWNSRIADSLAGPEVLAALLFTNLLNEIGKSMPYINIAGYRLHIDNYRRVPKVVRLGDGSSIIDCGWASDYQYAYASPTFRYL